jgi:hypothetical protein
MTQVKIKVLKRFHERFVQYIPGATVAVTKEAAARWAAQSLVEIIDQPQPEFAVSTKDSKARSRR